MNMLRRLSSKQATVHTRRRCYAVASANNGDPKEPSPESRRREERLADIKRDGQRRLENADQRYLRHTFDAIVDVTKVAQGIKSAARQLTYEWNFSRNLPPYRLGRFRTVASALAEDAAEFNKSTASVRAHLLHMRRTPYGDLERENQVRAERMSSMSREQKVELLKQLREDEKKHAAEIDAYLSRVKSMDREGDANSPKSVEPESGPSQTKQRGKKNSKRTVAAGLPSVEGRSQSKGRRRPLIRNQSVK